MRKHDVEGVNLPVLVILARPDAPGRRHADALANRLTRAVCRIARCLVHCVRCVQGDADGFTQGIARRRCARHDIHIPCVHANHLVRQNIQRAAADAVRLMLLQNVHGADGAVLHHHLHAQDAAVAIRLTRARVGAGAAGRKQNGAGTQ